MTRFAQTETLLQIPGELMNAGPELRAAIGNAAAPTGAASESKPPSAIARSTLEGNLENPPSLRFRLVLFGCEPRSEPRFRSI